MEYIVNQPNLVKDMARTLWENPPSPPCDLDENRYTYRSLHAEQKCPWPQSRRTHRLAYRGHRKSYEFLMKMTNMTFSNLCRSNAGSYDFGAMETLFNMQGSISIPIFIQIAWEGGG